MYKTTFWILYIPLVESTSVDISSTFSSFISCHMYIDSIQDDLIPETCYRMLFRKFQGVVADEFFDGVLAGTKCDRWPLATDQAPLVREEYRSTIPNDDFILSRHVVKILESIHNRFLGIAIVWPGGHQQTNLMAYQLMTDLTHRSICETTDCRVFRKLVEQFHFRLTLILTGKSPTPNKFDFVLPIRILLTASKFMNRPTVVHTRAVGCWDWLCRRFHRRQAIFRVSEPGIPLISRQVDPINTEAFMVFAGNQLDSVSNYLASVTESSFSIKSFGSSAITPLMGITRGLILSAGETADLVSIVQSLDRLITDVDNGVAIPQLLEAVRKIVTLIRAIIAHISIV